MLLGNVTFRKTRIIVSTGHKVYLTLSVSLSIYIDIDTGIDIDIDIDT